MESGDVFDADDPAFRTPPPQDDRIWRHPSELGPSAPPPRRSRRPWALAGVSALTGAVLAIGCLAAVGAIGRRIEAHPVVEREVIKPAVATTPIDDAAASRLAANVRRSIVQLRLDGGRMGSGVVFRDDGNVLTNAHVVTGTTALQAVLPSGKSVRAHVVASDAETDIAVLKLDAGGPFTPAMLGTSDGMAVGDVAVAVGADVSPGVVGAVGRDLTVEGGQTLVDMIQTDGPVDPASSGGALIDRDGTVVGITNAWSSTSRLGFATPIDVARAVADDLLRVGHVRAAWLGLKGANAPDGGGVAVAEVVVPGPAAQAGLQAGDVVRRIGTHPVNTLSALRIVLRRNHPGDSLTVVYDRAGARRTTVVILAERPATT